VLTTRFLALKYILGIHHDQIERYGGSHGVRDSELLLSALERPKASFSGKFLYPRVFDKAAALAHSLILNHPFIDGNKRTGIVSAAAFLMENGFSLETKPSNLISVALSVATKKWNLEQLSHWLEKNSKRAK